MRSSATRHQRRRTVTRVFRRAAIGAVGPFAAGAVVVMAHLVGVPLRGPLDWSVTALLLVPAVLVHCHNRAARHRFTFVETVAATAAAGAAAYILSVVGMLTGAIATVRLLLAHHSGVLTSTVSLVTVVSAVHTLRRARPA